MAGTESAAPSWLRPNQVHSAAAYIAQVIPVFFRTRPQVLRSVTTAFARSLRIRVLPMYLISGSTCQELLTAASTSSRARSGILQYR